MIKASIIIPYYKRKKLLINTINSISKQDSILNTEFEVLVIDDGSGDISQEDFLNIKYKLRIIKLIRNSKSCAARSRNIGAKEATGEILIFLDCDQIVSSDFISNHIIFFTQKGNDILQFGFRKMLNKDVSMNQVLEGKIFDTDYRCDIRELLYQQYGEKFHNLKGIWHLVFSCNISIKRETFLKSSGFDENFINWGLEDIEFAYRLKEYVDIVYNESITVLHQYHETIFDDSLYEKWFENLQYFEKKHNSIDVMLQRVFIDCYESKRREKLVNSGKKHIWNFCFNKFEMLLNIL